MTELNFPWEFTSEWASQICESSKLKYTEQNSHWGVDNCQSKKRKKRKEKPARQNKMQIRFYFYFIF